MGGISRPSTNEELLRQHEKTLAKLKNRPSPRPLLGVPMTPSSVSGVGLQVAGPGAVSLTAASGPLDFLDLFNDSYEDYLLYLDIYSSSANVGIAMTFLNGAIPYAPASSYRYGLQTLAYAGAASYSSPVASSFIAAFGNTSGSGGGSNEYTIFSPHRGGVEVKMVGRQVSSGGLGIFWGWCNSGVGQATGIRLVPSSGTLNGMLRCYGINPN